MSRKKDKYPVLDNVTIEAIAAEGNTVSHVDGMALFVPFAAPGDVCRVQVTKKRSNYREGRVLEFSQLSPHRTTPRCPHFGTCGGCKWQHVPYPLQLQAKERLARETLTRIGHVQVEEYLPIVGYQPGENPYAYRNKLEFTFSNKRWLSFEEMERNRAYTPAERMGLGFHIPKMFDKVLHIQECFLGHPIANEVRNFIFTYCTSRLEEYPFFDLRTQEGLMRTLTIRTTTRGDLMILLAFAYDAPEAIQALLDALLDRFPRISSLYYVINGKANDSIADLTPVLYSGNPVIYEQMGSLVYRIGPKSFYQTNSTQAKLLYDVAARFARIQPHEVVYDLYTGAGTIANYIASSALKVVGIEYVAEAVADAALNRDANGITNTAFYAGDMKDLLTPAFVQEHGTPHVVITDPPRTGMHPDVIDVLRRVQPQRIVYISCNPATQARDLALLTEGGAYRVAKSQSVDMFPHTHHLENVALLLRGEPQNEQTPL